LSNKLNLVMSSSANCTPQALYFHQQRTMIWI